MTTLEKVLFAVLGVVLVAFGIFVAVKEHQVSTMQTTINSSLVAQKTLLDNITLSSSQYVSKSDLDAFAAQEGANLSVIQQSLNTLNAQIVAINAAQTTSTGQSQTNAPSSSQTPNPTPPPTTTTVACNGSTATCPGPVDTYKYTQNIQTLALNEDFANNVQVPTASISFNAASQTPWNYTVYPRT